MEMLLQGWTNPGRQVAMEPEKFALTPRILEAVIGIKMFFCYFENFGSTITTFSGVHLKNLSRKHSFSKTQFFNAMKIFC
jgi:hypothetical protein